MKNLSFIIILFLQSTQGLALETFFWDNQKGPIQKNLGNCELKEIKKIPFNYSRYTGSKKSNYENLRSFQGTPLSNLPNFSLVKKISGPSKKNYTYINVLGINKISRSSNRWESEKGDKGYLYNKSMIPLEDYFMSVKGSDVRGLSKLKNVSNNTQVLFSIHSDHKYYLYNCNNKKYFLFNAFTTKLGADATPLFRLGVLENETSIFKSFTAYPKERYSETYSTIWDQFSGGILSFIDNIFSTDDEKDEIENSVRPKNTNNTPTKSLDPIVCTSTGSLNVRDKSLNKVIFQANQGEKVKIFQSWSDDPLSRMVNGRNYQYLKIEFPNRENKNKRVGYVAKSFIKEKEKCPYSSNKVQNKASASQSISSLIDRVCCDFPISSPPTHSYTSGERSFGSRRWTTITRNGKKSRIPRKHAASDLYSKYHEPVRAVAPGKISDGPRKFYLGTYQVSVKHSGGFVVRYGEISSRKARSIYTGKNVSTGDNIGYVGRINTKSRPPMLHFELYRGNRTGSLSTSQGEFKRRSDLMDPTKYLQKWQRKTFD